MIKVVLFDLGNVILPVDGHRMARKLTQHSHLTVDEILSHFGKHEVVDSFEKGKLSPIDFFHHIRTSCSLKNLEFDEFLPLFNDIFEIDVPVVELIKELKKSVKLGMISNTNEIHSTHLLKEFELFAHFHKVWFSNDVGMRKPDPAIYQLALSHFNSKPEETVFIDDLEPNVAGAEKVGIKAIHFKNYELLVEELSDVGVLPAPNGAHRRNT